MTRVWSIIAYCSLSLVNHCSARELAVEGVLYEVVGESRLESRSVPNTEVSITGVGSTKTDATGYFKIEVPGMQAGDRIRLVVTMPDHQIFDPRDGLLVIPRVSDAGREHDRVKVEVLRRGSKLWLTDSRLELELRAYRSQVDNERRRRETIDEFFGKYAGEYGLSDEDVTQILGFVKGRQNSLPIQPQADLSVFHQSVGTTITEKVGEFYIHGGPPFLDGVLVREDFLLSYNSRLKIPNWVAYTIRTKDQLYDRRTQVFHRDAAIPERYAATLNDYRGSGYFRGHLVSPRDVTQRGESETNLLSAMAPQTSFLNGEYWLDLEEFARKCSAEGANKIGIVAGPLFLRRDNSVIKNYADVSTIGQGVAVPTHFFRVHSRMRNRRLETLSFVVPNSFNREDFKKRDGVLSCIVSLGRVEEMTGLAFFPNLKEAARPDRDVIPTSFWQ